MTRAEKLHKLETLKEKLDSLLYDKKWNFLPDPAWETMYRTTRSEIANLKKDLED